MLQNVFVCVYVGMWGVGVCLGVCVHVYLCWKTDKKNISCVFAHLKSKDIISETFVSLCSTDNGLA